MKTDGYTAAIDRLSSSVARIAVEKSLGIKQGETVTVETWDNGLGLARAVIREVRRVGALPVLIYEHGQDYVRTLQKIPKASLGVMGRHEYSLLKSSDAYVFIPGPAIGPYFPAISREDYIEATKYNRSWYDAAKEAKLRGIRFPLGYVGKEYASLLRQKPNKIIGEQLRACLVDFGKISESGREVLAALPDGAHVRLLSEEGVLSFTLKGESSLEDGVCDSADVVSGDNMSSLPPGQVIRGVDPKSVEGVVSVSSSVSRFGRLSDATFRFQAGVVVDYSSKRSAAVLRAMDAASSFRERALGYLMVGLNPKMRYGYGQDGVVKGAVSLTLGFQGLVREPTMEVDGKQVVKKGRLVI